MSKLALLIGVSEYEPGLNTLPSAVKDVEAIYRILKHSDIGGFSEENIVRLCNPNRQRMEEAIEQLFFNRQKNDLVLLFFSGHGIKDDTGKLYLANCKTRKTRQGELIRSTAVAASFIHDSMNRSRSRHQVIILDCCFSGAFAEGLSAKDDGSIDLKAQLGGEGRVILTSSTSTQYSFEQANTDLSIYTRYLVEGLESGAADQDKDGQISVDELHEYAKQKVQEIAPAMKPEIYAVKEGFKIRIAHTLILDPQQQYGKAVVQVASRGEISDIARVALTAKQTQLGLSPEEALAIESEVLQPSRQYQQNLRQYEQKFIEAILQNSPLKQSARNDLRYLQQVLELKDEDINDLEARIGAQAKTELAVKGKPSPEASISQPTAPQSSTSQSSEFSPAPSISSQVTDTQSTTTTQPLAAKPKPPRFHLSRRLVIQVAAIAAVVAAGYPALQWYFNRDALTTLQLATLLQSQGNYEECVRQSASVTKESAVYTRAQALLGFCQVKQAQQLVQNQQLPEAITLLSQVPVDSAIYSDAQTLLTQLSALLLDQADEKYDLGEQDSAFTLVDAIPSNSTVYPEAERKRRQWSDDWVKNSDHLQRIRRVLEVNDLQGAMTELQQISTLYWVREAHDIILAKMTQIIAYEQSIGTNSQRLASARQLQTTADNLLQEAEARVQQRSQQISSQKPLDFPTEPPTGVRTFIPPIFRPGRRVPVFPDSPGDNLESPPSSNPPFSPEPPEEPEPVESEALSPTPDSSTVPDSPNNSSPPPVDPGINQLPTTPDLPPSPPPTTEPTPDALSNPDTTTDPQPPPEPPDPQPPPEPPEPYVPSDPQPPLEPYVPSEPHFPPEVPFPQDSFSSDESTFF
ncbi:caspase family protein [Egbenema bharatensis]|uniref:caspase family protein n=1 Tax=Egbenema bharatensis TaxID=3463334 RepID=UPI003A8BB9B6